MRTRRSLATLAGLAVAFTIATFAFAHDMNGMSGMSGDSMGSATNGMGEHMTIPGMAAHMKMTTFRPANQIDYDRAQDILAALRRSLAPYKNYRVALARGYRIFLPDVPQDVYHFTDYGAASAEYRGDFQMDRPGSLLYTRNSNGDYELVGAMYSAPVNDTEDDLNNLVPLSIARWHQHTNICLPNGISLDDLLRNEIGAGHSDLPGTIPVAANPEALQRDKNFGVFADGRFGFTGKIADPQSCAAAGGHFLPVAFGWMVHVYPFAGDDINVAFGMDVPKPPQTEAARH